MPGGKSSGRPLPEEAAARPPRVAGEVERVERGGLVGERGMCCGARIRPVARVLPAVERVDGLARADLDREVLVTEVLAAGAGEQRAVASDHAAVVAVRVHRVADGRDVDVAHDRRLARIGDRVDERVVGLVGQPRRVVRRDRVGEAAPVDHPVARVDRARMFGVRPCSTALWIAGSRSDSTWTNSVVGSNSVRAAL